MGTSRSIFKMARASKGELLARVNFPLYVVKMLTSRHLLVAGGGGRAKTGIANAVEIYELSYNGESCCARPAARHQTGDMAVMNGTVWFNGKHHVFAAGVEGDCQLYQIKYKVIHAEEEGDIIATDITNEKMPAVDGIQVRRRLISDSSDKGNNSNSRSESQGKRRLSTPANEKYLHSDNPSLLRRKNSKDKNCNSLTGVVSFDVMPIQRLRTDFCTSDEPGQKVVKWNAKSSIMATAGYDGNIRIWKYPELIEMHTLEAHQQEVDDIDINSSGSKIASVSRDGHAYVWDVKEGKKDCELMWNPPHSQKYRFRNCRYGTVESSEAKTKLFTAHVPTTRQKVPCYLIKWNTDNYKPEKVMPVGMDCVSALAISDNGRFLALGTMTGAVDIYVAFSLQRVSHVGNAHNIFVTGLEFLPTNEETSQVIGIRDVSLISISVDNQIKIHHVEKQATIEVQWVMLIMVFILFVTFTVMSYLGL